MLHGFFYRPKTRVLEEENVEDTSMIHCLELQIRRLEVGTPLNCVAQSNEVNV